MSQRISLTEDDFKKLVRGEIVTQGELQVALQDLGHCEIFNAIVDAINGTPPELQAHSFREDEEGPPLDLWRHPALKAKFPQYRFTGAL